MGKKKEKVADDTPVERIEYFTMKIKDLKKFAVKVGEELGATRKERYDLETDRDNIMHYWSNAVYQLMKVERDVRRLEREMIHKKNLVERSFIQKQYDLVDARYDSMTKLVRVAEGSVSMTFDKIRDVIKTERTVFSDRLQLRNEYWNTILHSDIAIMRMKQRARCREMDKITLAHKDAILETVDERNNIFDGLYDRMESEAEEQFRRVILMKNKKVHDLQKEHDKKLEDIQRNFEEIRNNDLIFTYRQQIFKCKEDSTEVGLEVAKISGTYNNCLTSFKVVQTILKDLKKLEPSFHLVQEMLNNAKQKFKELDNCYSDHSLEIEELEDELRKQNEGRSMEWKACFKQISIARQRQIKIHFALQNLTRMLSEELVSKEELLARYHKKRGRNFLPLLEIYNRFRACRLSLQEVVDRTLRACGSNLDGLGVISPEDFLKPPPTKVKLPPLPELPRAPTERPRLEWAYPQFRIRPAVFRKKHQSATVTKNK